MKKNILWFSEVGKEDTKIVGGKGANLGEMVNAGFPVPNGFIVTADAYTAFLEKQNLVEKINDYLRQCDINDSRSLQQSSETIKRLIKKTRVPKEIADDIIEAYLSLDKGKLSFSQPLVAIRSSATAEDLPTASFAGQQATFLNVKGEANVVEKVKDCWASLFEARAIFYRQQKGFDHFKVKIAVPVQKMVQAEASGVLFTVDPITGDKNSLVIEAIFGLGEYIVQGTVTPDYYLVDKRNLHILKKNIAEQKIMLSLQPGGTKKRKVKDNLQKKQKITDQQILALAKLGKRIEKHYYFPQDIEWAVEKGKIYIVQTRPITTLKEVEKSRDQSLADLKKEDIILQGDPASPGIASGPVCLVKSAKFIDKVSSGDILVAEQTNPDYVPAMRKAVAIVTEKGGRTSHAAIVSRELGIPAVVGAKDAMKILKDFPVVTVEGNTGNVYKGAIIGQNRRADMIERVKSNMKLVTATKLYVNLAEPSRAAEIASRHVDGVGLLRAEFMIAHIGKHPKLFIKEKKEDQFISQLSEQLEAFCSPFNPRPVVYRATDFKTNEYRNLKGGELFEPEEANPMMGFRGAARYIADAEVFRLELEAIKYVRNKKKLKNLWLMIPFVRTPEELLKVKKIVSASGLTRAASFKLWIMVELPVNVIMLEDFIEVGIDGVSIGSNDLTMLILGTDRDNSEVAHIFDERNPAVLWALERVIKICHQKNITSSICGQAPSDYPELVEKLVNWGITSISVNPDAIDRTRETIYQAEKKLLAK